MTTVHGEVAPGFEPVRQAFERNFAERGEVGAAVSVVLRGRCVVDLWGGVADPGSGRPWQEDTLALLFSTTKGITATCVHLLVERGKLDLDATVSSIWPEFAAHGKERVTVRDVLTHRAGVPAIEAPVSVQEVFAWDPVCAAVADQRPVWEPGTKHGYHVRTFGWILGELVRRTTGASLGAWLAREVAAPLGLDLFVGLPGALEPRVATLIPPPEPSDPEERALRERFLGPDTLLGAALLGPSGNFGYGPLWNTRELHAAELPSSNGIGTARSLARFYAACVGDVQGTRILAPETVARATEACTDGPDALLHLPTRFGLGYMLPPTLSPACPPGAFGHPGAGGSLGFADPELGLGFGYAMNRMDLGLTGDPRASDLVEATYASLRSGL
ncbi:MAG: serine hydrolase domain-containing protein [Myxococcota bacterium]|nr:serine hydrolase domain-containing protein [Myxococcota bacterium]